MEGLRLIMNLSSIITGVPEYIEFGWVTAPNAAGQSITSGTITTLTLTTEVADTGNLVSAPSSNQFTLPAGTYYYEANTRYQSGATLVASTFSLYNETDGVYVTRSGQATGGGHNNSRAVCPHINGQMTIAASKAFSLRLLLTQSGGGAVTVSNGDGGTEHGNSTANADQRTTIKLWKLR